MKNIFISIAILATLIACNDNNRNPSPASNTDTNSTATISTIDSVAIVNNPANNLNVQANSFSEIDTSGILMFPLIMGESASSNDMSSYKRMPDNNYWNIAFYNSKTGEQYLLGEKKMLIKNFTADKEIAAENKFTKKNIIYSIIITDFNGDKLFSETDATYLFITDKTGKNLKQISPSNYDLQNYHYLSSTNKLIMTVKKDSDNNKKFDEKDEVTNFIYDVEKGTEAVEILNSDLKNKLKVLYDKDWKKVKN